MPILLCPAANLCFTTQTSTAMIAHIMVTSVDDIAVQEADRQIKIFLSCFNKFDQELGESTNEEIPDNNLTINNVVEQSKQGLNVTSKTYESNSDEKTKKKKKKSIPSWISSSNSMCLCNIPNAMKKFGPLRLLWEGGNQGEGYLRIVKQHAKMGLRGN